MIATVLRRIHDPDTVVRSACVEAVAEMSLRITRPAFSVAFLRPFMEALTVEQDVNAQIGGALCLAAAVEAAPEVDVELLRRNTLPRLGKVLKTESCKAKAPVLVLIGSVVSVGGAASRGTMNWLVPYLVELLGSEDWTVRKASAEALGKVASVERDFATQHKVLCLESLQNRRFDKVKVVRETMNRVLDMWKEVKDVSENVPSPVKSACASVGTDDGNGRCGTRSSPVGSKFSQPKKMVPSNRSPPSTGSILSSGKRESPLNNNDKNSRMGMLHQQAHKKLSDEKLESPISKSSLSNMTKEDVIKRCDFEASKPAPNQNATNLRADVKRVFGNKMSDEKIRKFGGSKARVVPCYDDDDLETDVTVNNDNEICESPQDVEDLSLIRDQLVQIENQQSNLLDLLQRFIGTSQNGMNLLETRVYGLEMALDEISYDLAVSSGRIPNTDAIDDMCCKLPGTDFLSSKFWKKTDSRYTTSRLSFGSSASTNLVHNATDRNGSKEIFTTNSKRFQHRRDEGGSFMNPLAEIQSNLKGSSGQHSYKISKNFAQDAGSTQSNSSSRFDGISSTIEVLRNQNIRSSA